MYDKRNLTEHEIESIVSFIVPQKGIPEDIALSTANRCKNGLRTQLINIQIYPEMIKELKETIEKQFNTSIIQPGESVGVISAQSIGEKQTQTTLNTFHKAGSSTKAVTTGVPRVEELLNATKSPKSISCTAYTTTTHESIAELRQTIGSKIVELTLKKLCISFDIIINKEDEKWYKSFKILYGSSFTNYTDCISLTINKEMLYEYRLSMKDISDKINNEFSDMVCVFSPDNIGQIDIFVDRSSIKLPENREMYIDTENANQIYLEEVVQPILYDIIICGIEGIGNIFFNEDPNCFETDGSNFIELLGVSFIDSSKTISNNMWDIYDTLGVEATRQFLIEEFMTLCSGINLCHIQLLIDKMTFCGSISSISRYTMRNSDSGPLGKASFEETMDNFLRAGAYGQEETTNGVSASIICGKRAQFGTGLCDLKIDLDKLHKNDLLSDNVTENNISTPCIYKRIDLLLSVDKFINCKYKARARFGVAKTNGKKLSLSFDYETAENVILNWKDGIKTKKQIFKGYNSEYNVYMHSADNILKDGDKVMMIEEYNPVKIKKTVSKDIDNMMKNLNI